MKLETALMNPVIQTEKLHLPGMGRSVVSKMLREVGYAQVEEEDGEVFFLTDGKRLSPREFADMLSPYNGFLLTWQIRDASGEIPDHNTYYLPVRISDELLMQELEELIRDNSRGENFISYRDTLAFHNGFIGIYEKLELYYTSNPPGKGKLAGLRLIHRLEELETDDDDFLQYQVEMIRNLIGD